MGSAVAFQKHIESLNLLPGYGGALRSNHTTEMLLLKVYNDILHNMEQHQVTSLVGIDLSAAFDTGNHDLLLEIMEKCFGVCGTARQWMSSYLSDLSFDVRIDSPESEPKHIDLKFSVLQGSINGPIYFTCYVSSTLRFVVKEQVKLAGYADYHNLYTRFRAGDLVREETSISGLSCTLDDISGLDDAKSPEDE